MINEKLAQHISNELWVQKSKVVEVLGKFEGEKVEPPKRDYTGVLFKHSDSGEVSILEKATYSEKYPYSISKGSVHYMQGEVEWLFSEGLWLEIPQEETPTIHASKPSDIEERVKALEKVWSEELLERVEALEDTPIVERKKQNLSINTQADWKKVECLSWEDVIEAVKDNRGLKLGDALEIFIKNKLKN